MPWESRQLFKGKKSSGVPQNCLFNPIRVPRTKKGNESLPQTDYRKILFHFFFDNLSSPDSVDGTPMGLHHDFSMPSSGGSGSLGFHQLHLHHHANQVHQVNYRRPLVPRGSHSSDTSSAYSGSDTMQVCRFFRAHFNQLLSTQSYLL